MGGGERVGGDAPRRVTHLQPDICDDLDDDNHGAATTDVLTARNNELNASPTHAGVDDVATSDSEEGVEEPHVDGDLLVGLEEAEPEFDAEERRAAERAERTMRYLRKVQDAVLYEVLAQKGFTGPMYEIVQGELAGYATPVLHSWIRRGLIFHHTAEAGRPVKVSHRDREVLDNRTERASLVGLVIATALNLFRRRAVAEQGWTPEGGAALTTFFVGTCVAVFSNVFRVWQTEQSTWSRVADTSAWAAEVFDPDSSRAPREQDPSAEVVSRRYVATELARMPDDIRAIAEQVLAGRSQAQIAEQLGTTERAVEGKLHRFRREHKRRHGGKKGRA